MSRRQKKVLGRILLSAMLWIGAWVAPLPDGWKLPMFLIPYALCGWDVVVSAIRNLWHGQLFDEQFLMALATIGAFVIGDYLEGVAVMLFYQVGELFQSMAVGKSRRDIAALMNIRPDTATVLREGREQVVAPEAVRVGETIVIQPGEKIPLDGVICEGTTAINAAALTGESAPVDKQAGDRVWSGAINLSGLIYVTTDSAYEESTVARILELIENCAEKKARVEQFITRFARYYTPCVVGIALLLAVCPPLLGLATWAEGVRRALLFLVVSCPCALVVSVPLTFFSGIGGASRRGILIKSANDLETLSRVQTVVLDKTGTLTKGTFTVAGVHPESLTASELLEIAALAESHSSHPIARSIVAAYKGVLPMERLGSIEECPGRGIKAIIDQHIIYAGNRQWMETIHAPWHECQQPGTVVHLATESEYLGHIVIADELKPDAKSAIESLRAAGVRQIVVLTGDRSAVGEAVGAALGVDETRAELLPSDKVAEVEKRLQPGAPLAFVGDGINDAPVLARADVGIAMGGLGSDAAIEAADVVLMDDRPSKIPVAIRIARKTMRIARQNIGMALVVKGIVLLLGALGDVGMGWAVFADVGVLIAATLNAMRALRHSSCPVFH